MNTEKVVGIAGTSSGKGKDRMKQHEMAIAAKNAGELAGVYEAYEKAVEDRAEVEEALMKVVHLGNGDYRQTINSGEPIRAIRDVALAAIELAKQVALSKQE